MVNSRFMVNDVWFKVVEIQYLSALGLRQNEVQEEEKPEPAVEGDPADNEESPGLEEEG